MKRKAYGRDAGLSRRLLFTTSCWVSSTSSSHRPVLVLNAGIVLMVLIIAGFAFFQYFTSDKLALKASGAKVVDRDEAPELHAMVERLCAIADLPKPRVAVIETTSRTPSRRDATRSTPLSPSRPASGVGSSRRRSRA